MENPGDVLIGVMWGTLLSIPLWAGLIFLVMLLF